MGSSRDRSSIVTLVAAGALVGLPGVAHADEWDKAIEQGNQKERQEETPEERARREERVARAAGPSPAMLFVGAGLGSGTQDQGATKRVALAVWLALPLSYQFAMQARLTVLVGKETRRECFASYTGTVSNFGCTYDEEFVTGALADVTARLDRPNFFLGIGPFGGRLDATSHHAKTAFAYGGVAEAGLKFGPARSVEIGLRSSNGYMGGDDESGYFGSHLLVIGWSPVSFLSRSGGLCGRSLRGQPHGLRVRLEDDTRGADALHDGRRRVGSAAD